MDVTSLGEQLLFSTVRVETDGPAGMGVGTAFIVSKEIDTEEGKGQALFLVTNKHVVADSEVMTLRFTMAKEGQPVLDHHYRLPVKVAGFWTDHPDPAIDVTIGPFVPLYKKMESDGFTPFFRSIPLSLIPSPATELEEYDAIENCIFVGYPNGIWDSENNLPIVRRGTTATPIAVDFRRLPQFLIDGSVFPGSSGSPVLSWNMGTYPKKGGGTVVGSRTHFLGLISSVFFQESPGRIEVVPAPTGVAQVAITQQMIDLGVVLKARTVREVVEKWLNDRS